MDILCKFYFKNMSKKCERYMNKHTIFFQNIIRCQQDWKTKRSLVEVWQSSIQCVSEIALIPFYQVVQKHSINEMEFL